MFFYYLLLCQNRRATVTELWNENELHVISYSQLRKLKIYLVKKFQTNLLIFHILPTKELHIRRHWDNGRRRKMDRKKWIPTLQFQAFGCNPSVTTCLLQPLSDNHSIPTLQFQASVPTSVPNLQLQPFTFSPKHSVATNQSQDLSCKPSVIIFVICIYIKCNMYIYKIYIAPRVT